MEGPLGRVPTERGFGDCAKLGIMAVKGGLRHQPVGEAKKALRQGSQKPDKNRV